MVGRIRNGHDKLLAADRLKMKFIRIAGHELRTPVSYILGTVRLLKDSQDPTRLLHAIQKMGAKAKRLDEIIRSMFKLMPDQVRAEEMQYRRVRTADLLEEIHLDCFPFADKMGQRIIMEGADRVESFRADGEKLRDVLENLVMNAIRFTPNGGVIKIRVSRQLGDHVSFAVQDQGPGIGENDLPHIFEPFYSGGDEMQHSSGAEGDAKGVGLGLAIVRNFVEMHGGEVNVSSGPHGSVFTVTVPIEPPAQQAEGTAGPQ
jgi:signal transduction histidine kinase